MVVFFYNTAGFILAYPLLLNDYKHKGMQKAADISGEKSIELIVLKKEDVLSRKLNFLKIHSREFRLNGNLYDIVRQVDKDSLIYIYCINDKNEEQLEKEFHKMTEENAAGKTQVPDSYNQFCSQVSEAVCYLNLDKMNAGYSKIKIHNMTIHSQYWDDIPTPPPRSFSSPELI